MANTNTSQQWQTAARNLIQERAELDAQFDELDKLNFGLSLEITRISDELRLRDASGRLVVPLGSARRSQLDQEIARAVDQQRINVVKQGLIDSKIEAVDEQISQAEGLAQQSLRGLPNTNAVTPPATVEPNTAPTSVPAIDPIPTPQISAVAPAAALPSTTLFDDFGTPRAQITPVPPPQTTVEPIPPQPVTITTAPPDDPQAGEFEAGQFQIAQELRTAPEPITVLDPETGLPVETLASLEERQRFAAQQTGISPYGEQDDAPEFPADAERIRSTPADTEDEFAGNGYGFVYDENGELIPADSADAERVTAFTAEPQPDPSEEDDPAELARIQQEDEFEAARQETLTQQAQQQAALKAQQRQINRADWRVRLTLADSADYLYMDPGAGQQSVLYPLKVSNGVVFPYVPKISTSYRANYDAYDLTHSNYRGYFYKGSNTDAVSITATFTAQDTAEANYVLAVIHFFRAVTRMFYGANDPNRGTPPPLVFLHGLGQYQFSGAPCVVSNFMYSLPDDVDYIRAGSANTAGLQDLNYRRDRAALPTNVFTSAIERLRNAGLPPGAEGNTTNRQNFPDKIINSVPVFGQDDPTYVPTKIEIEIELLPMQSRQQISQEYNFADYASGKLITRGYW